MMNMSPVVLETEFSEAVGNLKPQHIPELAKSGVSYEAILRAGYVGVLRVEDDGELYRPDPEGFAVVVMGVWAEGPPSIYNAVENPELIDLIAWRLAEPTRWWRRVWGSPPVLGEDQYLAAVAGGQPVQLHPSPYAWLKSGASGCCFLQDAAARWAMSEEIQEQCAA